ncbi:MAG: nucleotide exchange factor GrpE, partial [Tumebacillaceae bacterium]
MEQEFNEQVEANEAEATSKQASTEEATQHSEDSRTREELLAELQKVTAEADDYKTRYLRAQADFDNFRRRSRQEKE